MPYDLVEFKINLDNRSFKLIQNGSCPNFNLIDISLDKKNIDIEQIRELIIQLNKSSFNTKPRFVLIDNIEYLNLNSVNALLKTLEEPNENIFFILINSNKKIIPTLLSRCINFNISLENDKVNEISSLLFDNDIDNLLNKDFKDGDLKIKNSKIFFKNSNCLDFSNTEKTEFRKKNIGYIFQNNQLLEDFNVQENVALPLILNGESYKNSCKKALNFLKLFGLENRMSFKPGLLSGGEQQRVAVARAMIKSPSILLADEPTGRLDDNNAELIFNYIIDLSKKNNTLAIIATHNTNFVSKLDVCFKIEKGKLIEI